jgi:hypothetical protein
MTSEAIPVAMVKPLNCSSTRSPTSAWATRNAAAWVTLTWPEGIGRERVRSTRPSRSRSTMSFQVQPAPRIAKAPMKNSRRCHRLGNASRAAMAARPEDHQQGMSKSHEPIGRSRRASRR